MVPTDTNSCENFQAQFIDIQDLWARLSIHVSISLWHFSWLRLTAKQTEACSYKIPISWLWFTPCPFSSPWNVGLLCSICSMFLSSTLLPVFLRCLMSVLIAFFYIRCGLIYIPFTKFACYRVTEFIGTCAFPTSFFFPYSLLCFVFCILKNHNHVGLEVWNYSIPLLSFQLQRLACGVWWARELVSSFIRASCSPLKSYWTTFNSWSYFGQGFSGAVDHLTSTRPGFSSWGLKLSNQYAITNLGLHLTLRIIFFFIAILCTCFLLLYLLSCGWIHGHLHARCSCVPPLSSPLRLNWSVSR